MADLVGEAWVRITADTTPMRRAIKKAAGDAANEYTSEFGREVERIADAKLARARQELAEAMVDPTAFDRMARGFDRVEDAAENFRLQLDGLARTSRENSHEFDVFRNAINRWERSAIDARRAAAALEEQQREATEAQRIRLRSVQNFFRVQTDGYRRLVAAQRANNTQVTAVLADEQTKWGRWRNTIILGFDRVDSRMSLFNYTIGRMFGKGSRSELLNFMGSLAQGITALFTTVPARLITGTTRTVDRFFDAFSAARLANVGRLASAGKGLLAIFGGRGGLVGAIAGAGIALVAFGKILPGVVSLLSMLAGTVVALASSISFGLVGALLAVGPAAAAGAAGIVALAGVFTSFFADEKNKKFVEDLFRPFKELNKSYYPEVRAFLTNVSRGFDDLINDIRPSLDAFFTSFNEKINDPTTTAALSRWSDSIGRIAESLSRAGTSFLSGLIGFFVPVLPYAERLADWIERIAGDFDRWANSARGQNSIASFMERAWNAARLVKDILGEIGELIGRVFNIAEPTGTGFLEGIRGTLSRINDQLERNPDGLREWFADVKGIGEDVGSLAKSAGTLIKNLNSPEARESARQIGDALVKIGEAAEDISAAAEAVGELIDALLTPVPDFLIGLFSNLPKTPVKVPVEADTKKWDADRGRVQEQKFDPKSVLIGGNAANYGTVAAGVTADKFNPKTVIVNGDKRPWEGERAIVVAQKFGDKTVKVNGNTANWTTARQGVANYAFSPKYVSVGAKVNWGSIYATKYAITSALSGITVSVRVAGVNAPGGTTMGSGGRVYGPTYALIGEAGPEAVVPLDRPLSMVDPSVRELSAIAQGMKSFASGGIAGGSQVVIEAGAIVVQSMSTDPAAVAREVVDQLAEQFR